MPGAAIRRASRVVDPVRAPRNRQGCLDRALSSPGSSALVSSRLVEKESRRPPLMCLIFKNANERRYGGAAEEWEHRLLYGKCRNCRGPSRGSSAKQSYPLSLMRIPARKESD